MIESNLTPEESFAWAEKQIATAKAEGATDLDLNLPEGRALDRLPQQIAELTQLETLNLRNTQVSELSALQGLSGLQRLHLDNTLVSDLSALRELSGLQTVTVNNTQVADLLPLTNLSQLGEGDTGDLSFRGTPAADKSAFLGALAAIENGKERARQLLRYLKELHLDFGGSNGAQTRFSKDLQQLPEEGSPYPLPDAVYELRDEKHYIAPYDAEANTGPSNVQAFNDMRDALIWAASELLALAEMNKLGRRDNHRLSEYIQMLHDQHVNARLLQLIARSLRASIVAATEEGRLHSVDQQTADDFLHAHLAFVGAFYPEVQSLDRSMAVQEIDDAAEVKEYKRSHQEQPEISRREELISLESRSVINGVGKDNYNILIEIEAFNPKIAEIIRRIYMAQKPFFDMRERDLFKITSVEEINIIGDIFARALSIVIEFLNNVIYLTRIFILRRDFRRCSREISEESLRFVQNIRDRISAEELRRRRVWGDR